jgi:LPXTG-motif cell wall-anchored protein
VTSRHIFAALLLAVVAAEPARAQFTATVAPPKREKPAAQVTAEAQAAAQADTSRRTQLSEMRAWVDSAAEAATGRPVVRQDSTTLTTTSTVTTASAGTVEMPDTASPLPAIALAGGLLLGLGGLLLRRPTEARARRRRSAR